MVDGEMQVCTQSTTLEELRPDNGETDVVVDVRPAKMTFKSVERLSNVDRPVPSIKKTVLKKKPANAAALGPPSDPKPASNLQQSHSKTAAQPTALKPSSGPHTLERPLRRVCVDEGSSFATKKLKGILKIPDGKSKRSTSKRVMFVESHTTIVVPRYLQDCSMPAVPKNLPEILRHKELKALSYVLSWRADWLDETGDDPLGIQLLPILENYPSLQTFRDTLQPILMRELWQDIRSQYRSIRQPLPLAELGDVHVQEIPFGLCQITCKAFIRTKKKYLPWGNEIGVLYYASQTKGRACRLFAYVSNRYRDNSANRTGVPPDAGECFNVIMQAALSELEDLRSGSRFSFCPITTIMAHLRGIRGLHFLEFSPLLPNMLSPVCNDSVRVTPGSAFDDKPEVRDAIVARIQPGTLNEVQMGVVLSTLEECSRWDEPSISLIQGPPGTGKSRVISHLALELMYIEPRFSRPKVLICAQSNTAVDVIAKRLMCLQKSRDPDNKFELLRIGTREKVDERCLSIFIDDLVKTKVETGDQRIVGRETNNNMRDTYRSELVILDSRIRKLEQDLANNPDVNRSRLDECYQRRARLNEQLSHTTAGSSYMSAEQRISAEKKARVLLIDRANIVCTTLGSCSLLESYCPKAYYDVCIIDEATQCTELNSLLPLMYGMSKMVLVGDINQLPATVLDQESIKAGFRQSLFSRLQNACRADKIKMLTVQYRMHPEISRWPNEYFYKGQLKNDPSTYEAARGTCSLKPYLVVSLSYDQELTQIQHEIYNRDEIEFVVGLLKGMVQSCRKESSIAIITPYQRHKVEIMNQLRKNSLKQVQVHSIDSVQGKEYDVVIVSLARSNGAGFLNSPERINVALTRARQCLVLCGNFGCLRQKPVWKSLLENAEKRDLFVHVRGDSITHATDSVLQRLVPKKSKQ
uniref:AAA+ ATPase domain-containing protein n=1 Tax=Anopheles atroparvus TaxID=41427 RepID=A0A182JF45_ANOAO